MRPRPAGAIGRVGGAAWVALIAAGAGLAGCAQIEAAGEGRGLSLEAGAARQAQATQSAPAEAAEALIDRRMRPAPKVFEAEGTARWDGRRTLQGIWVAHPTATTARRVRIVNTDNGAMVDGALFRRDGSYSGSPLLLSSDAARALEMSPGEPTVIRILALERWPGEDAADAIESAESAEATDPAESAEATDSAESPEATEATDAGGAQTGASAADAPAEPSAAEADAGAADAAEAPAEQAEAPDPSEAAEAPAQATDTRPAGAAAAVETETDAAEPGEAKKAEKPKEDSAGGDADRPEAEAQGKTAMADRDPSAGEAGEAEETPLEPAEEVRQPIVLQDPTAEGEEVEFTFVEPEIPDAEEKVEAPDPEAEPVPGAAPEQSGDAETGADSAVGGDQNTAETDPNESAPGAPEIAAADGTEDGSRNDRGEITGEAAGPSAAEAGAERAPIALLLPPARPEPVAGADGPAPVDHPGTATPDADAGAGDAAQPADSAQARAPRQPIVLQPPREDGAEDVEFTFVDPDTLEAEDPAGAAAPETAEPDPEAEAASEADAPAQVETAAAEPSAPADGLAYIQAGIFSIERNAARLAARIREAGLPAETREMTLAGKPAVRVVSGPYRSRSARAEALRTIRRIGPDDAIPVRR